MTRIYGKRIANKLAKDLKRRAALFSEKPKLSVVSLGEEGAGASFVEIKRRFGRRVGVNVKVHRFSPNVDKEVFRLSVLRIVRNADGVVIQLPLPKHFKRRDVLNLVPPEKDPDVLNTFSRDNFNKCQNLIIPPVAAAVEEILSRKEINLRGKKVIVVGAGFLVGDPVASWLRCQGILPKVLDKDANLKEHLSEADAIISGVGKPSLISPDMIKEGVVLIDAGTSGQKGQLEGDVDPECEEKASVFTPVPGGVGPITVAKLFENLLTLIESKK